MALYRQLKQGSSIRLLRLSQYALRTGSSLQLLECSLDSVTLPPFYGLSYCWGSPDRSEIICIESTRLQISTNLRRGLEELAGLAEFDGAYFWIDQICVNQDDLVERSHQVTLMQRVYQTAKQTVIWLSSPFDTSGALETHAQGWSLAQLLHAVGHTRPDWTRQIPFLKAPYPLQRAIPTSSFPSHGLPASNDPAWTELNSILSNPWFSRIWVLQEAKLSRIPAMLVYAGRPQSLEHALWAGAWLWQAEGPRVELGFSQSALSNIHAMFIIIYSSIPWRIEPLLMGTDKLDALDLRDKVIGLLGLVALESMPKKWVPNYNHTAAEVYRDVTRAVVEETGKMLIFEGINYQCGSQYNVPESLPSWVPRIHDVWPPVAVTRLGKDESGSAAQVWLEGFRTCRGRHAQILKQDNPDILPLLGLELEEVGWASPVLNPNSGEDYRLLRWLEEGIRQFCSDGRESPDTFVGRFFHSLAHAKYFSEVATMADLGEYIHQHGDNIPNQHTLVELLGNLDNTCTENRDSENVGNIERNMRTISNFFVTKKGKIGFGPRWTTEGDLVVALYGFEAPFILRSQRGFFVLLGSSYVPGFMEGEGLDLLAKGEIEEKYFWLA